MFASTFAGQNVTDERPNSRKMRKGPPLVEAPVFLRAKLAEKEMTQADFARRMGRPKKTINEIVQGVSGITWKFAIHCEYVLGIQASVLMKLQEDEELYRARVRYAAQRSKSAKRSVDL